MSDSESTTQAGPPPADMDEIFVEHPFRQFVAMYFRNYAAVAGLLVFVTIVGAALFAPMILDLDPFEMVDEPLLRPGEGGHLLGTDNLGRDLFIAIVYGARVTMAVGGAAAGITLFIGLTIGAMAGFYRGWVDEVLMRVTEFFQVLPPLLLAMVLVALFSPTLETVAISIGVVSWTGVARLARAEFLRLREQEFVKAARSIGARDRRIIWLVIMPNALPPLIVNAALTVGIAILFEAALSFLGLSDPNVMSWGKLIGDNRDYLLDAPWTVTFPGVAIFLTVLAMSLIGDGLTDAFNPKLRER
ncbi:MAG: ABC transporter permease [Rhodospirillaceae bacterium]|jgi:peptide/nickel transport system permease protein|nr:ABC transporter permease [Rhodospirillaceae bacterium]MBT4691034.1 ABC transporter permease [Rhodospirillaceae bacterium]MBT5079912.1 ABC transporter permease [Rhodospirillaceae bacterium]MBT5525934.1 ABC transporter permease [Rhodospirillaceae bacterium]MBT5879496.1 ABC transporter permease [Rhodospirillaceae bacterium]